MKFGTEKETVIKIDEDNVIEKLPCLNCDKPHLIKDLFEHLLDCIPKVDLFVCIFCQRGFSSKDNHLHHNCSKNRGFSKVEFLWTYSTLVCTGCGIQLNLECFKLDEYSKRIPYSMLDDYQNLTFAHNSKKFIVCAIHLPNESSFESVRLNFSSQILNLENLKSEDLLSIYLNEVYNVQHYNLCNTNKIGSKLDKLQWSPNRKFNIHNYFEIIIVDSSNKYYVCCKCTHRSRMNANVASLVQHIRDQHIEMVGNMRFLNAQAQFDVVQIDEFNKRYRCKACNHLTKANVKASALSQHFNDKHSDLRIEAVKKYIANNLEGKSTATVNDSYFLDRDPEDLGKDFGNMEVVKCVTSIKIHFPQQCLIYPRENHEFLDDDVYKCQLCNTLCSGIHVATLHYEQQHQILDNEHFDPKTHATKLFSFMDFPISMIPCFICNAKHCSILSLRLHLQSAHQTDFSLENMPSSLNEIGQNIKSLIFDRMDNDSSNPQSINFFNNASNIFSDVKMEEMTNVDEFSKTNGIQNDTEVSLLKLLNNVTSTQSDDEQQRFNTDYENNVSIMESQENDLLNETLANLTNPTTSASPIFSSAFTTLCSTINTSTSSTSTEVSAIDTKHSTNKRKNPQTAGFKNKTRPFKSHRFNAQEQFEILKTIEGKRFRCFVCGHTTKPNVSTTTLSQHFYDRHPYVILMHIKINFREIRAQITQRKTSELPRKPINLDHMELNIIQKSFGESDIRVKSPPKKNAVVTEEIRVHSSSSIHNSPKSDSKDSSGWELWKSDDDIVFGRFFETNCLDEFERLERNQSSVFSYFDIVIKKDPEISARLICSLSQLYSKQKHERTQNDLNLLLERIQKFIYEILKRSKQNGNEPILLISEMLERNPESQSQINISVIFRIFNNISKLNDSC